MNNIKDFIPEEVRAKAEAAKSDKDFCKTLADNGVDVEKLEGLLSDEIMQEVSGGSDPWDSGLHCPSCGNRDRDQMSYQFWASMIIDSGSKYRCKACNRYFEYSANHGVRDLGPAD